MFGRTSRHIEVIVSSDHVRAVFVTPEDIDRLKKDQPSDTLELIRIIASITHTRLFATGRELTVLYDTNERIREKSGEGIYGLFDILRTLHTTLQVRAIFYIEKHPIVEHFFSYRFDSRFPSVRVNERTSTIIHDKLA